jgi:GNAT superfamily N-acetyltransferase
MLTGAARAISIRLPSTLVADDVDRHGRVMIDTEHCGSDATRAASFRARAVLRDGTAVCLRAIRPDDKERLRTGFEQLSPRSVYRRFFHPVTALTDEDLRHLTEIDFRDHVSLALTVEEVAGEKLIAVGRFVRAAPAGDRAEIAVTVADEYQGRSVGTLLLRHLIRLARAGGVRELVALVLDENREMLEVLRNLDLPAQRTIEDGVHRVVLCIANTREP